MYSYLDFIQIVSWTKRAKAMHLINRAASLTGPAIGDLLNQQRRRYFPLCFDSSSTASDCALFLASKMSFVLECSLSQRE